MLHEPLPEGSCVRQWVQSRQSNAFQELATEADQRRDTDPAESTKHFLSIDYVVPITDYPRVWSEVECQLNRFAKGNGEVPWTVAAVYAQLVADFRANEPDKAVRTMADLAHYTTDAFSVLHDTKNFDPGLGIDDRVRLHSRWESRMFDARARITGITNESRRYFGTVGRVSPTEDIFEVVISGNALVQPLIDADIRGQGDLAGLYDATFEMTSKRWGDSLTLLASLVAQAWEEAGSPQLVGMSQGCSAVPLAERVVLAGYPLPPTSSQTWTAPAKIRQQKCEGVTAPVDPSDGGTASPGEPNAPTPTEAEGLSDASRSSACAVSGAGGWWLLALVAASMFITRRLAAQRFKSR